jgi:biopolymer transport protein ExbD
MGHETQQRSGCSPTVLAVLLVLATSLLGLVLFAGAASIMYLRARHQQAMVLAEHARAEAEVARLRAEEERARAEAMAEEIQADQWSTVVIGVDQSGALTLDGQSIQRNALRARLGAAQAVLIEADAQCPMEHVAGVMNLCRELSVNDMQVHVSSQR